MPHFIISTKNINEEFITVDDKELYKHIIKVMRTKIGEKLCFLDENEISYESVLKEVAENFFVAQIKTYYKSKRKLPLELYVAQSVLNSNAQISSIQKATELGVKGIIPLYTDNCSVKESVIKVKIEKWQKVAMESVKQCERADIPIVCELSYLKDIIDKFDKVIVFAEKYTDINFFEYIKKNKIIERERILVVIGPEGGFSEREFNMLQENKIPLITLGNLIYRADTALCAALTTVINGVLYA